MRDTHDGAAARARGQALRNARVARARSIRRRIVAGSVALFVAAWLLITIVLVSGHDPALASKSSGTTSSSGTTVASTPAVTTTSSSSSTNAGSSSGGSVSSVTTSQS
jgi:hypothetical protein